MSRTRPNQAIKIKLGQQKQADKPIYLLSTGVIECGKFRYKGRHQKKLKAIFDRIYSLAHTKSKGAVLDVSDYKYWDAPRIYDEYVIARWCKSVSAVRLERFARETRIVLMLAAVQREFKRAVALRWKREFEKSDPNDENTPRQAWQIL